MPSHAPAAEQVPAAEAQPAAAKKRNKVRSAWIGFAGRVTAQLIGAIATVGLGYALVTNHAGRKAQAEAAAAAAATTPAAVQRRVEPAAAVLVPVRRPNGPALAVLPFEDFSPTAAGTSLADGVTESLTAALARDGRVHVTSRTSAMHVRKTPAPLRDIAATLGVDVVVEGSIVRQGDRARVTVQLIDAATDAHLWAQTYERPVRDVLAFEGEIGVAITRDLASVLPRELQTPSPVAAATADARTPQPAARATF
jgi:TolB-like protein